MLERESKYYVIKSDNQISFKKETMISTYRFDNIINTMKIMRKGIILLEKEEKDMYNICWKIPNLDIYFRSIISALIISLSYYFYYSDNIVNTTGVFFLIFTLTAVKNLIVLKLNISYINKSVF